MGDPGRAVERALGTELGVHEGAVRICAGVEQPLGRCDEGLAAVAAEVAGVGDVEQREPAERLERHGRIDSDGRSEHEGRGGERAYERRVALEQRVGVIEAIGRRRADEGLGALAGRRRLELDALHERRPAPLAELARDRELRRRELQPARERTEPRPRLGIAAARRGQQCLGLAPRPIEIDPSSVHCDHLHARRSADAGRRSSPGQSVVLLEVCLWRFPRTGCALARTAEDTGSGADATDSGVLAPPTDAGGRYWPGAPRRRVWNP